MNTSKDTPIKIEMETLLPLRVARVTIRTTVEIAPLFLPSNVLPNLSLEDVDELEMRVVIDRKGRA